MLIDTFGARQQRQGLHRPTLGEEIKEIVRRHCLPTQSSKPLLQMIVAESNEGPLEIQPSVIHDKSMIQEHDGVFTLLAAFEFAGNFDLGGKQPEADLRR